MSIATLAIFGARPEVLAMLDDTAAVTTSTIYWTRCRTLGSKSASFDAQPAIAIAVSVSAPAIDVAHPTVVTMRVWMPALWHALKGLTDAIAARASHIEHWHAQDISQCCQGLVQ